MHHENRGQAQARTIRQSSFSLALGPAPQSLSNALQAGSPGSPVAPMIPQPRPPLQVENLGFLKDVPVSSPERNILFSKKLKLCTLMVDWSQPYFDERAKMVKRATLIELVEYVSGRNIFNETNLGEVMEMIKTNVFRPLPPSSSLHKEFREMDPEEEEAVMDVSWQHLQFVYEFLLRVVTSEIEPRMAKKFIDLTFVSRLLDMFDAEDPRERDLLKTILHRIYAKFMALRGFIRKSINNILFTFIYETERHNGISELLEIFGSIINGFVRPLKEEHKVFLQHVLIPLHKVKSLAQFHQQLSYCIIQFVDKDPSLALVVVAGLLKFWPAVNSPKEVLFLIELEELLEMIRPEDFQAVQIPLFKRIAKSIGSYHFQVAERSLLLWNNELVVTKIFQNREETFPLIFSALYTNSRMHWNNTISGLAFNVLQMYLEIDSQLFDECSRNYREQIDRQRLREEQQKAAWEHVESLARARACPQPPPQPPQRSASKSSNSIAPVSKKK
eukprot:gnl/Spiro4/23862_TR11810_c0_g1_i1.p1 gnl/Spiro4/23862_TR11810_c0_g1~~gnl/Spiro4/23862_TR11810_c0_g1_i1.p1  ORF type:complete len:502 (+),score=91.43 gnl/Spiro4/23862_TR11810_c0_g1_i1:59-1564(+)